MPSITTTDEASPRIGILVGAKFSPNIDQVLYNLARMLNKQFDLDLLTHTKNIPERLEKYYSIFHQPPFKIFDREYLRSSYHLGRKYIEKKDPDLLMNVNQPQTLGVAVGLAGKFTDVNTIIRMTGDNFDLSMYKGLKKLKQKLFYSLAPELAFSLGDRILTLGDGFRRKLINRGYHEQKISVLPQPFDHRQFDSDPQVNKTKSKKELELDPEPRTILFVGRLSRLKGADRLLKIIELCDQRKISAQFCLVGTGKYRKKLANFSPELVHLAGEVPPGKVADYYRAADLFVFPSRTEGLPGVILEALAAGLPVVASPVGVIPEYVDNLAEEPEQFVEYIAAEKLEASGLPPALEWENLKESYRNLFRELVAK